MRLYRVKLADGLCITLSAVSSCAAFILAQEITGQFATSSRPV